MIAITIIINVIYLCTYTYTSYLYISVGVPLPGQPVRPLPRRPVHRAGEQALILYYITSCYIIIFCIAVYSLLYIILYYYIARLYHIIVYRITLHYIIRTRRYCAFEMAGEVVSAVGGAAASAFQE